MGASIGDIAKVVEASQPRGDTSTPVSGPPIGYQPIPYQDLSYTRAFRPGYREFGPSGQFQQPIYRSSYENYVQPAAFYSPGYDLGPFYNPFVMDAAMSQAAQPVQAAAQAPASAPAASSGGTSTGMAYGGPVRSQGIDALLK